MNKVGSVEHLVYEIKVIEGLIKDKKKAGHPTKFEEALIVSWKKWGVKLFGEKFNQLVKGVKPRAKAVKSLDR